MEWKHQASEALNKTTGVTIQGAGWDVAGKIDQSLLSYAEFCLIRICRGAWSRAEIWFNFSFTYHNMHDQVSYEAKQNISTKTCVLCVGYRLKWDWKEKMFHHRAWGPACIVLKIKMKVCCYYFNCLLCSPWWGKVLTCGYEDDQMYDWHWTRKINSSFLVLHCCEVL